MTEADGGELGYRVSYVQALQDIRAEQRRQSEKLDEALAALSTVLSENKDLRTRTRSLELRFYGILAGLITAAVVLVNNGGLPSS